MFAMATNDIAGFDYGRQIQIRLSGVIYKVFFNFHWNIFLDIDLAMTQPEPDVIFMV